MTKVYMAVPFEECQGFHYMARVFSTKAAASAYCEKRNAENELQWEVAEFSVEEV